jgi:hypothetical protein
MAKPKAPAWPISELEWIAHDQIVPNPRNPRVHSPDQVDQIAASILEFGWTMPILIDESRMIRAGHGRWLAAARMLERGELKSDLMPCIWARGWSEKKIRAYVITDNKLTENSEWNIDMLVEELAWLDSEGFDLDLTGFGGDELAELLGGTSLGDGDDGEGDRETLAERFGFVPFTVFMARDGLWQDRKRAWLSLGMLSELGRGAKPGGSRQPAVDPKTGKIVRATSTGRPIPGAKTDAEADKMIVAGKGWGAGGPARRDAAFYKKKRDYEAEHGKISTKEFREKHWNPDKPPAAGKPKGKTFNPNTYEHRNKIRGTGEGKPAPKKKNPR